MGAKRKVDLKLYNKLTRELKTPKDDAKVMAKYHLGQTTVRAVRKSYDYEDFIRRTTPGSKKYTPSLSRRAELTKFDRLIIALTWVGIIASAFVIFAIIRWLISVVFGV